MTVLWQVLVMSSNLRCALIGLALVWIGCCTGCGNEIPDLVPMSVTVTSASGGAVNNALVKFVPLIDGLDGNHVASGVTGKDGRCELKLRGSEELGALACEHKVLVTEGPPPDDARAAYFKDQGASIRRFEKSLKNRPIPKEYERLFSTPLKCTPSVEQSSFEITL
jgi:hypothetical protein